MTPGGYQVRRPPAHAGPLRSWERITITLLFVLLAAGIAVVMVLTARPSATAPPARGHRSAPPTQQQGPGSHQRRSPGKPGRRSRAAGLEREGDPADEPAGPSGAYGQPRGQAAGTTTVFMILSARVCRLASQSGNSQPM
jgi:hypothetical protein